MGFAFAVLISHPQMMDIHIHAFASVATAGKPYEHQMVRTDSRAQTLHAYMHAFQTTAASQKAPEGTPYLLSRVHYGKI